VATVAHQHLEPAEYRALQADAGWTLPLELIDGQVVVIPPSGRRAASAQGEFFYALRRWQENAGDRGLLLQDMFVGFPDYVAPDIAWWRADRRPVVGEGALDAIPDLVVEVLSPKTRANDLGVKRELYMSVGVCELWLVDPPARTLTRVLPEGRDITHGAADVLTSELLPGFKLAVADVFIA
jgi:Uma2 family endonuclease